MKKVKKMIVLWLCKLCSVPFNEVLTLYMRAEHDF